jgi:hypothetical protein
VCEYMWLFRIFMLGEVRVGPHVRLGSFFKEPRIVPRTSLLRVLCSLPYLPSDLHEFSPPVIFVLGSVLCGLSFGRASKTIFLFLRGF